jgi:DNA-binding winged helix-turn-helix (wHTH) protein
MKLNAQPFQVLLMLLQRPGDLLTRDEISHELWPDGTFVDFEHGVHSAINRIREALGDTAGSPRYVETLARRGYRFVAPVERIGPSAEPLATLPSSLSAELPEPAKEIPQQEEPAQRNVVLTSPHDLPRAPYPLVQTLFILLQLILAKLVRSAP